MDRWSFWYVVDSQKMVRPNAGKVNSVPQCVEPQTHKTGIDAQSLLTRTAVPIGVLLCDPRAVRFVFQQDA